MPSHDVAARQREGWPTSAGRPSTDCPRAVRIPRSPADSIGRLAKAGCAREVFASDALALLHEASQGYTRDIDRLASLCLEQAAQTKERLVDRSLVRDQVAR